jgi:hypothetical protein
MVVVYVYEILSVCKEDGKKCGRMKKTGPLLIMSGYLKQEC